MKRPEYAPFAPPRWLRNPHAQSVLSSAQPRRWLVEQRAHGFRQLSTDLLVACGDGVRLHARYTPAARPNGRLVIMLHGWEGSSESVYNLSLGPRLHAAGFDTVRLNMRDHGDSHHLNEELFHSCRLTEMVDAVAWLARRYPARRLALVGYSLGGNFALRIAREAPQAGIELEQVIGICPVLDPAHTMEALVSGPAIYERYFINKWRRSLYRKREVFPHLYDFENLTHFDDIRDMTEHFVLRYTDYGDLHTYLGGYALTEGRLDGLEVPAVAVLADDDPVIPVASISALAQPAALRVLRTRHGGHCGFLHSWRRSWIDDFVVETLG